MYVDTIPAARFLLGKYAPQISGEVIADLTVEVWPACLTYGFKAGQLGRICLLRVKIPHESAVGKQKRQKHRK